MKGINKIISLVLCLIFILCTNSTISSAKSILKGYMGDFDNDMTVSSSDLRIMIDYMFGSDFSGDMTRADLDNDNNINISDLILLKSCINGQSPWQEIYEEQEDKFLSQITEKIDATLPSHGQVNIPVFFVDFPDCRFNDDLSYDTIHKEIFGPQNEQSDNYPFESISAFFERSSKDSLKLNGSIYKYTAKYPISYYSEDVFKTEFTKECLLAFDDVIDFNDFDSNHDGCVDCLIFSVPQTADDQYWWPCAGYFGDGNFTADGFQMGHTIVGNEPPANTRDFNSGYAHELGHCLGLPDYYILNADDAEGMHGSAGTELMDCDAHSDLSAVSKLMLGWYKEDQTELFDYSENSVTYTLHNAQTDQGNCIIIPKGLPWDPTSEFFIIEYQTETANNSDLDYIWWQDFSQGVRIYHANTDVSYNGWWHYFTYENAKPEGGTRFIRLVNDGYPSFTQGSTIDSNVPGFGWYNEQQEETIDPGVSIHINSINKNDCSVTISIK